MRFRGGATTTLTLPRPLTAQQLRATHEDVRQQIDALLDEYTDAQVAHMLNERGLRTGAGEAFDSASIQWVRFSHKIKSLKTALARCRLANRQANRLRARSHPRNSRALAPHRPDQGPHLQ